MGDKSEKRTDKALINENIFATTSCGISNNQEITDTLYKYQLSQASILYRFLQQTQYATVQFLPNSKPENRWIWTSNQIKDVENANISFFNCG